MDILQPKNALVVYRGSSKTFRLTVADDDQKPINLTGGRLVFTMKASEADDRPLIFKTSDQDTEIKITNATAGLAEIYLVPADTSKLQPRTYMFDVWLALAGKQYPIVPPSTFDVRRGITVL